MESSKDSDKEVASPCVLCKKSSYSSDCPTCQNVKTYRAQSEERELKDKQSEETLSSEVRFPGPGIVRRSPIYGNYVVASRRIEAGELICLEKPLIIAPYAPSYVIPICLSCYKDVGFSSTCSKCRWPICSPECEENPVHKENECEILRRNGLRTKHVVTEYFSIEVLRGLLLRDKAHKKWKSILDFESHLDSRMGCTKAVETFKFIANFIRNRCNLGDDYDEELINHVTGVFSVNTFWGYKDLKRYSSILFDKVTLFAHDCDPNTNRSLIYLKGDESNGVDANGRVIEFHDEDCYTSANVGIRVEASRTIEPEEMITIQYVDVSVPVQERRQELKDLFYFDCTCSKCLSDIFSLHSLQDIKIESTNEPQIFAADEKVAEVLISSICCEN